MDVLTSRYLNSKQAMLFLNIKSYNTLYKFIRNGLPFSEVAGIKRFDKKELEAFMAKATSK